MACGLPVVCYDHGGQTDFLVDGTTGYMCKLNDIEAFTKGCRELVQNADLRTRIKDENLKRVEDLFIDKCAMQYEALFEKVIEARRGE
jgi:glycosyltransferase involved in cell wall biosynthesis